jgi:hypothetical protein
LDLVVGRGDARFLLELRGPRSSVFDGSPMFERAQLALSLIRLLAPRVINRPGKAWLRAVPHERAEAVGV